MSCKNQTQFPAIKQQEFTSPCNTNQRPTHIQAIIQRVNHTRGTAHGRPPPPQSQRNTILQRNQPRIFTIARTNHSDDQSWTASR